MPPIIISNNYFFIHAMESLCREHSIPDDICVIDTESFQRLADISRTIEDNKVNERHRIFFIGGEDFVACLLEPLGIIDKKALPKDVCDQLAYETGCGLNSVMSHINQCRTFHGLSISELILIELLHKGVSVSEVAMITNVTPKFVYYRISKIAKKYNFEKNKDFLWFLQYEFAWDHKKGHNGLLCEQLNVILNPCLENGQNNNKLLSI